MLNYIEPVFRPPSEARSLSCKLPTAALGMAALLRYVHAGAKEVSPREESYLLEELKKAQSFGARFDKVFWPMAML